MCTPATNSKEHHIFWGAVFRSDISYGQVIKLKGRKTPKHLQSYKGSNARISRKKLKAGGSIYEETHLEELYYFTTAIKIWTAAMNNM